MKIEVFISYGSDGEDLLDAKAHSTREDAISRVEETYESYLGDGSYDPEETFCSGTNAQIAFSDRSWIYLQVMESSINVDESVLKPAGFCRALPEQKTA